MALDLKQVLAQNKVLIVIYVIALAPIALWFVIVNGQVKYGKPDPKGAKPPSDKWNPVSYDEAFRALTSQKKDIDDLAGKLKKSDQRVYTLRDVGAFVKRNADREQQVKDMGRVLADREKLIDAWFDKYKDFPPNKPPQHGDFVAAWNLEIERLSTENAKLVGYDPATKRSFLASDPPSNDPDQIKEWQRRFWIQQEIVAALKQVGDVKLASQVTFPGATSGPATAPGTAPVKKPYAVIPVNLGVIASFRDLPKLVRELVARTIVFRLVKLDLTQTEFQYDRSKEFIGPPPLKVNDAPKKFFDQFVYSVHFANAGQVPPGPDEEQKLLEQLIPEPPVKIDLQLEAFDFKLDVLLPPEAPAPAGAPPAPSPSPTP